MSWTATTLLEALAKTGTPEHTIEAGHRFVRVMKDDSHEALLKHFEELKITPGTIDKAKELLSGKKKIENYLGTPPPHIVENEHLAKTLATETARIVQEMVEKAQARQAEASAAGIGDPTGQKEQLKEQTGKRR